MCSFSDYKLHYPHAEFQLWYAIIISLYIKVFAETGNASITPRKTRLVDYTLIDATKYPLVMCNSHIHFELDWVRTLQESTIIGVMLRRRCDLTIRPRPRNCRYESVMFTRGLHAKFERKSEARASNNAVAACLRAQSQHLKLLESL